jgi:putative methyltransferase (TIGR04325 family)
MFKLKKADIWFGVYENIESAEAYLVSINKKSDSFKSDRWLKRQQDFLKLSENNTYPRPTSLPNFVHALENGCILDFGGGSGWVQSFIPKSCLYLNYELPDCVKYFSKLNQKTNKLFIKELTSDQLKQIDVLYSNSVIQYLKSLDSFFNLIDIVKPNIILIDDVQTSTLNDFISLQKYYGEFIITKFFSLDKLLFSFQEYGYELVYKVKYESIFPKNMKPKIGNRKKNDPDRSIALNLLFKRVNQIKSRI